MFLEKRLGVGIIVVVLMLSIVLMGCEPVKELTPPVDATYPTDSAMIEAPTTEPTANTESVTTEPSFDSETTQPVTEPDDIPADPGDIGNGGAPEGTVETTDPVVIEMSSDPFSYQVSIDGTVIQLPCKVSDLAALGWVMDESKADNTLDENYTTSVNVYNGDCYITLSIYNDGDAAVKFTDAMVDDISVHKTSVGENAEHEIFICGGLTIGSTKDEVKAIYGNEPKREYSDETSYSSLTYEGKSYRYKIEFSFKDDVVVDIGICSG